MDTSGLCVMAARSTCGLGGVSSPNTKPFLSYISTFFKGLPKIEWDSVCFLSMSQVQILTFISWCLINSKLPKIVSYFPLFKLLFLTPISIEYFLFSEIFAIPIDLASSVFNWNNFPIPLK